MFFNRSLLIRTILIRLLFLVPLLSLTACSTPSNDEPPAELTEISHAEYIKLLWSRDTGKGVVNKYVSMEPFIQGNKIYTIDVTGLISQMDSDSGKLDWFYESGLKTNTGLAGDAASLVATSPNGEVVLFDYDENSIKQRWKQQLKSEIRTKAVLSGTQVFIRTVDGKLSSLDSSNGEIQWTVSHRVPALSLTGNSFPLVTDNLVLSGFDDGKLIAFDRKNGSTVWEHTVSAPRGRSEIERLVDLDGQFVLLNNIIYISSFQGNLSAVTVDSGQVLWSREFSSFKAMDADQQALYLTDSKSHVWSIDRRTGSAFWKQDVMNARKLTAPRLIGDKIVVADLEGFVHILDKSDGRVLARIQPSDVRYIAQPEIIDNKIILLDTSGLLSVVTQDESLESPHFSNIKFAQ